MGKYQPYPNYKKASVTWLDEMPEHWILSKVKYIAPFQVGWTPPTKNDENFVGENLWVNISDLKKKVITNTSKRISDRAAKEASMSITPKGSLMYSFKLSVGSVSFAGEDMYTNEAIASFLDSARLPLSYLYYALPKFVIENASTNIYGARILNQELINNAQLLEPTFEEAENIANFLDHETAKIDALIEKQQQLIKLLKEKRQAVIRHAVAKGLNPQAPMKGSGVEWLGKVPEHWIVCRLKNALTIRNGRDYKQVEVESGGYPVYGSGGVFKRSSKYLFDGSSVLFGRKGTIDKPLVVSGKFWTVDTMFYSEINTFHEAKYIYYQASMFPFSLLSTSTALPSMTQEDLLNLGFVSPPLTEQQEIVEYLKIKLDRLEVLISKVEQSIILSKERRIALISAAVTGKIDVRNWEQPND
ncbi:restriction endonuclease subunit S [Pseudoalteromonas sp. 2CM37A]|uniref:restriction endonuclease subunit S n=1 Tax=Pseudoalteromonas sp. 2CM37A TaxID=2929853 RepID=UPI0020BEDCEB|nr:restriction endonuclease subunit S [Pseudoalteromonas sp. 2CM37A]MCK8118503.1 restriction endonuclease subunit S [Pseudoalteromonas sp. 2CM37A]